MTLQEGFKSCRDGNFVSHPSFDSSQSMHYFMGHYYYEDGACLDAHIEWLKMEQWAREGWFVKHTVDQVNIHMLNSLHMLGKAYISTKINYEGCILKGAKHHE